MKSTFFADGRRRALPVLLFLLLGLVVTLGVRCDLANAAAPHHPARIFVLMVWDGLRPDFVTAERTPNLFAMENEGVRFARHHSIYPTSRWSTRRVSRSVRLPAARRFSAMKCTWYRG
jgi:hypothetical protein